MKTTLLFLSIATTSLSLATEVHINGSSTCSHDTIYTYRAIFKKNGDDKKKGRLAENQILYQWFLPGDAFVTPDAEQLKPKRNAKEIRLKTVKVEKFPSDPKYWPKTYISCVVGLSWSKFGKEQVSSPSLLVTVTPQVL